MGLALFEEEVNLLKKLLEAAFSLIINDALK